MQIATIVGDVCKLNLSIGICKASKPLVTNSLAPDGKAECRCGNPVIRGFYVCLNYANVINSVM